MKISRNGLELIKHFEGNYLKAYKCPAGVWTIGIGHTGKVDGDPICAGMTITEDKSYELLSDSLEKRYEPAVRKLGVKLNQNQYDALVCFCYNLGPGIFAGNLLDAIKREDWKDVARQIKLYNKARVNGVLTELKGLTRRRNAEAELFLKPYISYDSELKEAVKKIVESGVNINAASWDSVEKINVKYVPGLIEKLGGLNKLVERRIIMDVSIWENGTYTAQNVRSLLIKYSKGQA